MGFPTCNLPAVVTTRRLVERAVLRAGNFNYYVMLPSSGSTSEKQNGNFIADTWDGLGGKGPRAKHGSDL